MRKLEPDPQPAMASTPAPQSRAKRRVATPPKVRQNCRAVVKIAVPVPLRRTFDYDAEVALAPGTRVLVPFGRRTMVGVVLPGEPDPEVATRKPIMRALDAASVIEGGLMELVLWAAGYYQHPVGEVIQAALPAWLRRAHPLTNPDLTTMVARNPAMTPEEAEKSLRRAPKQRLVLAQIPHQGGIALPRLRQQLPQMKAAAVSAMVQKLVARELVLSTVTADRIPQSDSKPGGPMPFQGQLNADQQTALNQVLNALGGFAGFVLQGITGSGKTEIYLHATEEVVRRGRQVLVLVPEIGLTPQLINRFEQRLGPVVEVQHSALSARERYRTWFRAGHGAAVILGTRSAVFTPLKNPGLIIVDEEHDHSFKQMDGFRYHARDLAVMRAHIEGVPIIIGSATVSMETHHNASTGKFTRLHLQKRVSAATLPRIDLIDTRMHRCVDGLTKPLKHAIAERLSTGQQTILYVNRRGYAPVAQCIGCGWQATCSRCDARLTCHAQPQKLLCHYCGQSVAVPEVCPQCTAKIFFGGIGTQRVHAALERQFPEAGILRFDSDALLTESQLRDALRQVHDTRADIIIGTQLIAKGHDFPRVTLVGILAPDQNLYGVDFRAPEQLFQQLVQVSGRAGRGELPGQVLIQTAFPNNPYLNLVRHHEFERFYAVCAAERAKLGFPPFGHLAMFRAESTGRGKGLDFLEFVRHQSLAIVRRMPRPGPRVMDPVAPPMEKLSGRFRAQLLIKSTTRRALRQLLGALMPALEKAPQGRHVRWSLDVDPMQMV